jgi:hypothetical protein
MKLSHWALAILGRLRERQFWHEMMKEALLVIANTASGPGVALTAAVFGMVRRALCDSPPAIETSRKLPLGTTSTNTSA